MLLSALLFSLMSLLVKLDNSASSYLVTFVRFLTGLIILASMSRLRMIAIKPVNLPWLAIRGFFGTIAVCLLYVGISKIGLGKGTMLNYTYPVFAAALSPLIVREKNSLSVWITLLVALGGCYMILNPSGAFQIKGIELLVLCGALCAGVAVNSIRRLSKTDNSYTIYAAFCLVGTLIMAGPALSGRLDFSPATWFILICIGVLATAAQLLMTTAYRHVRVAEGSIIAFLVPVLNAILGAMFFREKIGFWNIVGAVIVISCCTYASWKKQQEISVA
jgi:S-adenosylmethionine uptake transporter